MDKLHAITVILKPEDADNLWKSVPVGTPSWSHVFDAEKVNSPGFLRSIFVAAGWAFIRYFEQKPG